MFKQAVKSKLRFETNRGQLTSEDLYDLSLESLDVIAKSVNKKLKAEEEESFIGKSSKSSAENQLKLEILKAVIKDKLEDREKRIARAEKAQRRSVIIEMIQKKETEELGGKSIEELTKELAALDE